MSDRNDLASIGLHDPNGLCATCCHLRIVHSSRGSTFYRCQLAESDRRFAKYPRLPVVRCAGYAASDETGTSVKPFEDGINS